jgi:hypothetical protein
MFNACINLQQIPEFDTSAISSAAAVNGFVAACRSLARGRTNGIRFGVSYSGCQLSRAAIVDIFTGLGTASGAQTINVSNNIGSSALTADDELIATNKGWTVTK